MSDLGTQGVRNCQRERFERPAVRQCLIGTPQHLNALPAGLRQKRLELGRLINGG